jgi:hypothetical protein
MKTLFNKPRVQALQICFIFQNFSLAPLLFDVSILQYIQANTRRNNIKKSKTAISSKLNFIEIFEDRRPMCAGSVHNVLLLIKFLWHYKIQATINLQIVEPVCNER